jgi:hypothetical protein
VFLVRGMLVPLGAHWRQFTASLAQHSSKKIIQLIVAKGRRPLLMQRRRGVTEDLTRPGPVPQCFFMPVKSPAKVIRGPPLYDLPLRRQPL